MTDLLVRKSRTLPDLIRRRVRYRAKLAAQITHPRTRPEKAAMVRAQLVQVDLDLLESLDILVESCQPLQGEQ